MPLLLLLLLLSWSPLLLRLKLVGSLDSCCTDPADRIIPPNAADNSTQQLTQKEYCFRPSARRRPASGRAQRGAPLHARRPAPSMFRFHSGRPLMRLSSQLSSARMKSARVCRFRLNGPKTSRDPTVRPSGGLHRMGAHHADSVCIIHSAGPTQSHSIYLECFQINILHLVRPKSCSSDGIKCIEK